MEKQMQSISCWAQIDKLTKEGETIRFQEDINFLIDEEVDAFYDRNLFLDIKGKAIKSNHWTLDMETQIVTFRFKEELELVVEVLQSAKLLKLVTQLLIEQGKDTTIYVIDKINDPLGLKNRTRKHKSLLKAISTTPTSNEDKVTSMLRTPSKTK